jgi:hypothetical protein
LANDCSQYGRSRLQQKEEEKEEEMIKNTVSQGFHTLCDRCRCILATNFKYGTCKPTWEVINKPRKGSQGHTRRFDFCDERCRVMYFRGRKYWARKVKFMTENDPFLKAFFAGDED